MLAYGDAWMPNRVESDDVLLARIEELQRRAADMGRNPIPVTVYGASRDPERIARWEAAGVTRAVFWLPSESAATVEPRIDEIVATVASLRGAGA